eukprot:TRINITY_DN6066_c0_g1_i1.p1 TRINITY_DN6066_c0_g1~~TRINITY_DN6066_c0_g1_i1.p1  ORF type:complete len:481 (+),score=187.40 TRINITY_DN6066_c0_g1_i1:137-1444(+)
MQRSNPTVNRASWLAVLMTLSPVSTTAGHFKFFHIDWARCLTDPHYLRWLAAFSWGSVVGGASLGKRQKEQLEFTKWAVEEQLRFIDEERIECGVNPRGAVHIEYSGKKYDARARHPVVADDDDEGSQAAPPPKKGNSPYTAGKLSYEPEERMDAADLVAANPLVKTWSGHVSGGKFETEGHSGDCERFSHRLAEVCRARHGVGIKTHTKIQQLVTTPDGDGRRRVSEIVTDAARVQIPPDTEVVVAAGSWTAPLMATAGYYVPLYPMKGYCVVMDLPPEGHPERPREDLIPTRTLIDKYIYVTRMGEQVRVASMGEFAGWSTHPDPVVNDVFRIESALHLAPLAELFHRTPTRCGLRPYVADGLLMAGRVDNAANLSVNVGPGFNGWKVAHGAGHVLASAIAGEGADAYGFDPAAFSPSPRVKECRFWNAICAW